MDYILKYCIIGKIGTILISIYYIVQKIFYKKYIKLHSKELLWKQRFYSYFMIINEIFMGLCLLGSLFYLIYLKENTLTTTIMIINGAVLGVDVIHCTYVIRWSEGGI